MGAMARAAGAGELGTDAMSAFMRVTSRFAPEPGTQFVPPEPQQNDEAVTETVARRLVEGFALRRLPEGKTKELAGQAVHHAFGISWVALYALLRESTSLRRGQVPIAGAALGTFVWAFGDNTLLPLFRLAAWPRRADVPRLFYTWSAHLVYGIAAAAAYEASRQAPARFFGLGRRGRFPALRAARRPGISAAVRRFAAAASPTPG